MTDTTPIDELEYGIDKGSPGGDKTALTIKQGKKLFTFIGEEAEVIESLINQKVIEAKDSNKIKLLEVLIGKIGYEEFVRVSEVRAWAETMLAALKAQQQEKK